MGEDPATVFALGCPSADVVNKASKTIPPALLDTLGVGRHIDLNRKFLLVLFHPVTTEFGSAERQMVELLDAVKESGEQTILLWPNIDAGSDGVSQAIRRFREFNPGVSLHAYKNFEPELYIPILAKAACAVGNSSSFVRDASYLGTPVVLIGSRQDGREFCEAVKRVEPNKADILSAIKLQLAKQRYPQSDLYGKPGVSIKIVDALLTLRPYAQKRLHYFIKNNPQQMKSSALRPVEA
jgi:UDP-N-acetylglucosamine 2-epimerase